MTKKDINFIKHIKPKLKDREILDKKRSHLKRYEKALLHTVGEIPTSMEPFELHILSNVLKKGRGI